MQNGPFRECGDRIKGKRGGAADFEEARKEVPQGGAGMVETVTFGNREGTSEPRGDSVKEL